MPKFPLEKIIGIAGKENVLTREEDLLCYGYDASKLKGAPAVVVFPSGVEVISGLLRLAHQRRIPVVARGAGSGMVGGSVPPEGAIVLALNRLNRILEIDSGNMLAVVEPGVVTADLQARAREQGLFYPPDPASMRFSTIGGNVAMCSGGPSAVKYGVTRDYVMGLEAVLPNGDIIHTGGRTAKGVVGYDMTRLLVGSEGTLAVFSKIILKLIPAPEASRTMTAVFPALEEAGRAVSEIIRRRVIPSTLELLDQATLRVVEDHLHAGLPVDAEAMLLIEVDGRECILDEDVERIRAVCQEMGASKTEVASTAAERDLLWLARRSISPALRKIRPDKLNEDVVVPRVRVPELIREIRAIADEYRLIVVTFGHAGDGNMHVNVMLDRRDADELHRAGQAVESLFKAVLRLNGTISGEHGVGIAKSPFFRMEVGDEGYAAMLAIKRALDPHNILNPGKMFVPNRAFLGG